MKDLNSKKIIIAGGTSGIGLAAAEMFVKAEAEVIITGRDTHKLENAVASINASPLSAAVDASDRKELDSFLSEVGEFDHLIITVSGGKGAGLFKDLDLQSLRDGFERKFWPQLNCLQAALPYVRPTGSVTLITAVSATSRKPGYSGLAALNGGLESMIPVLAKELQPLRINAISPGVIDTSWWDSFPEDTKNSLFEQFKTQIPAGRIGRPEDVAKAIYYLIDLKYITGRVLQLDGGLGL